MLAACAWARFATCVSAHRTRKRGVDAGRLRVYLTANAPDLLARFEDLG